MKNYSISLKALLLAALGSAFLTGCATYESESSRASLPSGHVRSQLTVTPLTNPNELVKWSQYSSSLKAVPMLRSIETYAFTAPADSMDTTGRSSFETASSPGTTFAEPAGAGRAGEAHFLHTPGQR
jgi:hypothetical protein